jgi:hypothetical protein
MRALPAATINDWQNGYGLAIWGRGVYFCVDGIRGMKPRPGSGNLIRPGSGPTMIKVMIRILAVRGLQRDVSILADQ